MCDAIGQLTTSGCSGNLHLFAYNNQLEGGEFILSPETYSPSPEKHKQTHINNDYFRSHKVRQEVMDQLFETNWPNISLFVSVNELLPLWT